MNDEYEIKKMLEEKISQAFDEIRDAGLGGNFYVSDKTKFFMVEECYRVLEITHDIQEYLVKDELISFHFIERRIIN